MPSEPMNRRIFLQNSARATMGLATGATVAKAATRGKSANDKIIIGCIGLGGRGSYLARKFAARRLKVKDCEVAYVCDVKRDKLRAGFDSVRKAQGKEPKAVTDFRRILDDKDVDAIVNATPDHWHALPVVWGCQAGKHAYVEKPASHNIWEGRRMVQSSRKYKKVVQLGTQSRSCEYMRKCIDFIRGGGLGTIHVIKVYNMIQKRSSRKPVPDCDPPEDFDYERWLGPAPMRPYNPLRVGAWNWWWDYSGGDIINDGVHQMDLANWVIDSAIPRAVYATGGKYAVDDPFDAPDTQTVVYEFSKMTMTFELAMWTPYMHKTDWAIRDKSIFPEWSSNSTRVEIYGTKGMMQLGRHGGGWQAFGADGKTNKQIGHAHGVQGNVWHQDNFLKCIRSGKLPNSDILDGHLSTVLCHLGNISLRVGCKRLLWDGKAERFTNSDEANKLVKRTYRDPWVIKSQG